VVSGLPRLSRTTASPAGMAPPRLRALAVFATNVTLSSPNCSARYFSIAKQRFLASLVFFFLLFIETDTPVTSAITSTASAGT